MIIRDMFADDINRKINGVIKVDQSADDVTWQELNEYVITKELKKHFITFFNYYGDAFDQSTADMGVWISGFFGRAANGMQASMLLSRLTRITSFRFVTMNTSRMILSVVSWSL